MTPQSTNSKTVILVFIRTNGVLDRLGSCAVYNGYPAKALFASYLIRARVKPDHVAPHFAASLLWL